MCSVNSNSELLHISYLRENIYIRSYCRERAHVAALLVSATLHSGRDSPTLRKVALHMEALLHKDAKCQSYMSREGVSIILLFVLSLLAFVFCCFVEFHLVLGLINLHYEQN